MLEEYGRKEEIDFKKVDRLNHILGQYVGIAVNRGDKYPDKPRSEKVQNTITMTDIDMENQAKLYTNKYKGKIT